MMICFHNKHIILGNISKTDLDLLRPTHISQVQDETVSPVEAVPADRHLRRPHGAATFNLEQPLHDHFVRHNVLESGGHAPFLKDKSQIFNIKYLFLRGCLLLWCRYS